MSKNNDKDNVAKEKLGALGNRTSLSSEQQQQQQQQRCKRFGNQWHFSIRISINILQNSIRHNLSLHNRFMRVQNEGTGKSSWWMINPDAKPGKSARRRATSMETSKFEKRRGRVKKKVEALRNGLQQPLDATPSPSSSISEGLDLFPDSPRLSFQQLSPDFRPRASSNASSCGRLSPIPAVLGVEPDWGTPSPFSGPTGYGPEQLAGSLAERMKIHQSAEFMAGYNGGGGGSNGQQSSQQTQPPPPPPYQTTYDFGTQQQQQPDLSALHAASPYGLSQCPIHRLQPCSCHHLQQPQQPPPQHSPVAGMSPSYPQSEPSPDPATQFATVGSRSSSNSPPDTPTPSTMMGQLMGALNNSALLDDLNLNIETLHGGFDCNVDEVIKHELSMDGSLDFNFSQHHHHHHHHLHHHHPGHHQLGATVPGATQELQQGVVPQQPAAAAAAPYTTTVSTGPSWVH